MAYYPNLTRLWIPSGRPGTWQTIQVMARLARQHSQHPAIRRLAESLGDPLGLENFLRQTWRFVPDPLFAEYIRAPGNQLAEFADKGYLQGDCDDAATLAAAVLAALNWPAEIMAIRLPGMPEFSHVFVRTVTAAGQVMDIDPIVPASQLPITNVAETLVAVI